MPQIIVSLRCRTCQQTDGLRWQYTIPDDEPLPIATEDERAAALIVGGTNRADHTRCPFCGSSDLTAFDVVVAGRIFDHERVYRRRVEQGLTVLTLTIIQVDNDLKVKMVTNPAELPLDLMVTVLNGMVDWVAARPETEFAPGTNSTLICCVSAHWEPAAHKAEINWEHYSAYHLTKTEIRNALISLLDQYKARALGL